MSNALRGISYFHSIVPTWFIVAVDSCGLSGGLASL